MSTLVRVNYAGSPGSRIDPPEHAELVIECDVSNTECDAFTGDLYGGEIEVECDGDSTHERHLTTITVEDGPDPDDAYERMRDERMGL